MEKITKLLLEKVVSTFDDFENQSEILNSIDDKGNYVHEKLDEHLVSLGFPKGSEEYASTGEIEYDVNVEPNDVYVFTENLIQSLDIDPNIELDMDNMDDEEKLEEVSDEIVPFAAKNPKLLKIEFMVETTVEEFNKLKQ